MLIYLQMIETEDDSNKFIAIYEEYKNLLYSIAYGHLKNESDAEDAVHNVFLKIAENINLIEPVGNRTKQLVITMLNNRIVDMKRYEKRHPSEELSENNGGVYTAFETDDVLTSCIMDLPEKQRYILWLKYNNGYSLVEISKLLGMSVFAARKAEQRARKTLREMYMEKNNE